MKKTKILLVTPKNKIIGKNEDLITQNKSDVISAINENVQGIIELSNYASNNYINKNQIGVPNGITPLDGNEYVDPSYLPPNITGGLYYKGKFNAATIDPVPSTDKIGNMYIVSESGTWNNIDLITGDQIIWNGTNWDAIQAGNSVQSVNGETGQIIITKTKVGLGNVDNTADANKNVLSATKLTTARSINGVSFNGDSDITIKSTTTNPLTIGSGLASTQPTFDGSNANTISLASIGTAGTYQTVTVDSHGRVISGTGTIFPEYTFATRPTIAGVSFYDTTNKIVVMYNSAGSYIPLSSVNIKGINAVNPTVAGLYTTNNNGTPPSATSGQSIANGDVYYFDGTSSYYLYFKYADCQNTLQLIISGINKGTLTKAGDSVFWIGNYKNSALVNGQIALVTNDADNIITPTTITGDGEINSSGILTINKTNGNNFAASATIDTTKASNVAIGGTFSLVTPDIVNGADTTYTAISKLQSQNFGFFYNIATSSGTTTLSYYSNINVLLTGSSTQNIKLYAANASGVNAGSIITIVNKSTSVNYSSIIDNSGNVITTLMGGQSVVIKLMNNITAAGTWAVLGSTTNNNNFPNFFRAWGPDQSIPANVTTKLAYTTTQKNNDGGYNSSTSQYTATKAGTYRFTAKIGIPSAQSSVSYAVNIYLFKNGNATTILSQGPVNGLYGILAYGIEDIELAVGDTVSLYAVSSQPAILALWSFTGLWICQ